MSLSSFGFISILLLVFSIQVLQAQFWVIPQMGQCYGQFERYKECASSCPDTCDDIRRPDPFKICNMICRMGCECIPPFVRLNRDPMSPCVHPRECLFMWF
jgi:hypothetical protein